VGRVLVPWESKARYGETEGGGRLEAHARNRPEWCAEARSRRRAHAGALGRKEGRSCGQKGTDGDKEKDRRTQRGSERGVRAWTHQLAAQALGRRLGADAFAALLLQLPLPLQCQC
jgi:hypothetical protein